MEYLNNLMSEEAEEFSKTWETFLFNIEQVRQLGKLEPDKA